MISLSEQELNILLLISYGMSSAGIGERLFVSENTVEYHRKKLFHKFCVHNSAHLVGEAYRRGFLKVTDED
ncbi:MAG: response regulator transcription factor [Alloprevotella sp.]